jgi:hypothetical protein
VSPFRISSTDNSGPGSLVRLVMSIAVLCGTLVAGLWPFHSPRNSVSWLGGENGLRIGEAGTIVSAGEVRPTVPNGSACSVEMWVQPTGSHDSSTLLAFYSHHNPVQFALRQSRDDLVLERNGFPDQKGARSGNFHIDNVFRSMRPVLLTISSGPKGTDVYVDGVLAMASELFRVTASDCTGRLVVGTSPVNIDQWTGVLKGLAIYHSYLTAQQVARYYETWTTKERPEVAGGERCAALYLFTERNGNRVQNRMRAGCDLLIPEQYVIQDEILLKPFWREFALSWGYWEAVLKNIVGLVPLGFFLYSWVSGRTSARRAAWITTILGATVSITIEVLQAQLPTRSSGTTDILTNTFGTWLGVVGYRYFQSAGARQSLHVTDRNLGHLPISQI